MIASVLRPSIPKARLSRDGPARLGALESDEMRADRPALGHQDGVAAVVPAVGEADPCSRRPPGRRAPGARAARQRILGEAGGRPCPQVPATTISTPSHPRDLSTRRPHHDSSPASGPAAPDGRRSRTVGTAAPQRLRSWVLGGSLLRLLGLGPGFGRFPLGPAGHRHEQGRLERPLVSFSPCFSTR